MIIVFSAILTAYPRCKGIYHLSVHHDYTFSNVTCTCRTNISYNDVKIFHRIADAKEGSAETVHSHRIILIRILVVLDG